MLADVADAAAVAAALEPAIAAAGLPTILVNNAGYTTAPRLRDCTLEDWRREIDGNLTGAYIMVEAVRSHIMMAGNGGAIGERAVDVQVNRLRRKIERDPRFPRYLHTIRGIGYALKPD